MNSGAYLRIGSVNIHPCSPPLPLGAFIWHSKHGVLCVSRVATRVLQIHAQLVCLLPCQPVDPIQSQPVLTNRVAETVFVVAPARVEGNGCVDAFPEDGTSAPARRLVAENVERSRAVRVDRVNAASCIAGFVVLGAVSENYRKNGSWTPWGRNKPNKAENQFEKTTRENTLRAGAERNPIPYSFD